MTGYSREILKWLQSLNLSFPVKDPKRDFSNAFSVAEIFSRYYPDVQMHGFDTGISLATKVGNWELLQRFFNKHNIEIPLNLINDVIHSKPSAGLELCDVIYTQLTGKPGSGAKRPQEMNASNRNENSPTFARPTASKLIKETTTTSASYMPAMKNADQIQTQKAAEIVQRHKHEMRTQHLNGEASSAQANTITGSFKSIMPKSATTAVAKKVSTSAATSGSAAPKTAAPRLAAPRPVAQQPVAEQQHIEFKEVLIKPVELDIAQLRHTAGRQELV